MVLTVSLFLTSGLCAFFGGKNPRHRLPWLMAALWLCAGGIAWGLYCGMSLRALAIGPALAAACTLLPGCRKGADS